jgi:hypothetical protein
MEVKGKVKVVNATEEVGAKGFKKRLLVVETEETYPQSIPVEFVQDKCNLLDYIQVGQDVTVQINLRGSEYNGRYYVQLQGWKIEASSEYATTPNPVSNMQPPLPTSPQSAPLPADDLPF